MARPPYDPLGFVPSPEVIREKLSEALTLAQRLRLLLDLAERLRLPHSTTDVMSVPVAEQKAVAGA